MRFATRAFGSALLAQQAAAGRKGKMAAGENFTSGGEHIDVPQTSQRMGLFELNGRELDVTGRCLNRACLPARWLRPVQPAP